MGSDPQTCARPGCPEEETRIHGYCSVRCEELSELEEDVREEMAGQTAHALAQAAAWEAKAKGLEDELKRLMGKAIPGRSPGLYPQTVGMDGSYYRIIVDTENWEELHQALSAPRPSPSRILEVVRAAETWAREASEDAWALRADGEEPTFTESELSLLDALESLTPEERQALGEGDP